MTHILQYNDRVNLYNSGTIIKKEAERVRKMGGGNMWVRDHKSKEHYCYP